MKSPCSIALLESALLGNLPENAEHALHRHLEACEECSAALERMAGGPAWCQEAAALLTKDELDAALPVREQWSEIDFTVEHLEPSRRFERTRSIGRLRRASGHRTWRHGRCAEGLRPRVEAVRGDQGAGAAPGAKLAGQEAVRPRGSGGRGRRPSERAGDPPGAAGRALAVSGHAAGRRGIARRAAHGPGTVGTQGNPPNRHAGCGGARRGPRARPGASRREARQHPAGKGIERAVLTDFGLAHAADDVDADPLGDHRGNAAVHVTRAGPGRSRWTDVPICSAWDACSTKWRRGFRRFAPTR